MDLLSRRDHSEKEIREKLQRQLFSDEEIEKAVKYGRERGWLPDTLEKAKELSVKTAQALGRKKKGARYINQFLVDKGLPEVEFDSSRELEKALQLIENKFSKALASRRTLKVSREEYMKLKGKMGRFLITRGFESDTVSAVLRKVLK